MATITIPSRFNGPPASGNGGYSCGTIAAAVEGSVAVSLRRPVPLDAELEIRPGDDAEKPRSGDGDDVVARAFFNDELVAEAVAAPPPAPWDGPAISLEEARISHEKYAAPLLGEFSCCFVCGRARDDGFVLFTGPVDGTDVVASPWTPPAWAADTAGAVRPEFVWAALDCPAFFALHGDEMTVAFLVRQQAEIVVPLRAGVEYVVVGRPLERAGRKGLAATAVLDSGGEVLAHAEALFVAARDPVSHI